MPDDRQSGLLRDMLDSAILIRSYLAAVDRNAFLASSEKQDAVLRRFEIIGEAASRICDALRGNRSRVIAEVFRPDGTHQVIRESKQAVRSHAISRRPAYG